MRDGSAAHPDDPTHPDTGNSPGGAEAGVIQPSRPTIREQPRSEALAATRPARRPLRAATATEFSGQPGLIAALFIHAAALLRDSSHTFRSELRCHAGSGPLQATGAPLRPTEPEPVNPSAAAPVPTHP
jgi:hypothetical protein